MQKAKTENGDCLFSREEWLSKSQIRGFFSQLSSTRKKKTSPALSADDGEPDRDSPADQDDLSHMTIKESVINDIGLSHPIVYDVYNLCNYARGEIDGIYSSHAQRDLHVF